MSPGGSEHTATQTGQPAGQRRMFLDVLSLELRQIFGFEAVVVMRESRLVLYVVEGGLSAVIGCDLNADGWWFTWADDDRTIAPVKDYAEMARLVARALRPAQTGPW